jgi:AcrR family transcriptional regulator
MVVPLLSIQRIEDIRQSNDEFLPYGRVVAKRPANESDARERILTAGEQLFARDGIRGARARDIATLAGQHNPSALHYYFGSRQGLVAEILIRYQAQIDDRERELLAVSDGEALTLRDVLDVVVRAHVESLDTERGRNCALIVPQILHLVSTNLRRGIQQPTSPQSRRILDLLDESLADVPAAIRTERVISYSVTMMSLLAERAFQLQSGAKMTLDSDGFHAHLVSSLHAMLTAPIHVDERIR